MKIYAMSDIHGCIHSFLEALQLVDYLGITNWFSVEIIFMVAKMTILFWI